MTETESAVTQGPVTTAAARSVPELAAIAWRRARRFPPRLRATVTTRSPAPRWLAALIWPALAVVTGREAGWIRTVPGASATVQAPAANGQPRPDRRAQLHGVALIVLVIAAVAAVVYVLGFQLPQHLPANPLALLPLLIAFLAFEGAIVVFAIASRRRDRRDPEASARTLNRRRDELAADGPAYTVTWVLADRDRTGAAGRLLDALTADLAAQGGQAVLYPASEELIGYYARHGAVIDAPARRRMRLAPAATDRYPAEDTGPRTSRPGERA